MVKSNKKLNILCYQPYSQTVVYIESIIEKMAKDGNSTFLLSFDNRGDTHFNMERFGCKTYTQPIPFKIPILYHFLRVFLLVSFCNKNKIDIVYSHYQEANLISVVAQFLTKAKFVITRHHSDCGFIDKNIKEVYADKIINKLAKKYIAPSRKVYDQVVFIEATKKDKVTLINYGYNFDNFNKPDLTNVNIIRQSHNAELLIVMAARFIPEKRHKLLFTVLERLVLEGFDVKAIVLGKGPEEGELKKYVIEQGLQNIIHFSGFKRDIENYFAASDLVVHLSASEASNSAVKEAGLQGKSVIVCKDVGDFDDYIVHEVNGYLIEKEQNEQQLYDLLKKIYFNKWVLKTSGENLKKTVRERFDIDKVYPQYLKLHEDLFHPEDSES